MKLAELFFKQRGFEKSLMKAAHRRYLPHTLLKLVERGLSVPVVYDIGARVGDWSLETRKIFSNSHFIMFEATEKCRPRLKETGLRFFIEVLSDSNKTVDFYEKGSAGDSYYKEFTSHYDGVTAIKKETKTLLQLIEAEGLPPPNFLKLDTQGSELDIIKGAGDYIKSVDLMYIECPLIKYNEGAPTLFDYLSRMRELGFIPYDICEHHLSFDMLVQIDILFIRTECYKRLYPEAVGINFDV